MRHILPILACIPCCLAATVAQANDALPALPSAPADAAGESGAMLFVELIVNGRATGEIVPLRLSGDRMLVTLDALRKQAVAIAGDSGSEVDVAHLPGIEARYDGAAQMLHIDAAPELMPVGHIAGDLRARNDTVADWGAMLNYDAYVQRSDGQTTATLWTEQRLFGPLGLLSNTGRLRFASGGGQDGYLRYDTRIRHVDEERALTYTLGDTITQSLAWSRSVRIGGIQIARDYHVRPDLLTMPLPSFAGKTALPSTVDLFIDGYRQQQADVAPGRFVLDNIPVVNGAGQATIVTTDATGRQIATTIPFYVSSTLLRPGLLDFAVEAGFLRRSYDVRSFDYGSFATSVSVRRGITQRLTVEAHGEAADGLMLAGAGIVWAPWRIGTFNAAIAASDVNGQSGTRWSAGYNYSARRFSLAYQHDEQGPGFRDLGSFRLQDISGNRRSDRFIASVNIAQLGSMAAAYISGRSMDGRRARIATFSFTRPLGRTASLFLSADHDFEHGGSSAQLRLVLPFGRDTATLGATRTPGRGMTGQVNYARAMAPDGGLGIDASLASGTDGDAYGQGTLTWRTRDMQLQAGGAAAQGRTSMWGSATGTIVWMRSAVYTANQVSDAFALVSTNGVGGVGVTLESQRVGATDNRGMLFIPNINSYFRTRFAIDSLSLPLDQTATIAEKSVAFRQGTGAIVQMPVRRSRNVTVLLVDRAGKPLAPGGLVSRAGAADGIVGWDGLIYLEDVAERTEITVTGRAGLSCKADISVPAQTAAMATIGPVPCA